MTRHTFHSRLSAPAFVFGVALIALSACDGPVRKDPKMMSGAELAEELERCKGLGLKASEDSSCTAANKEHFERFMGRSKEPTK